VLVVGFGQEIIKRHFGDGSSLDVSIEYAHQEEQLGTADAVRSAKGFVNDRYAER
jgi:dTDP-glucose pyrophosphorylase